MVLPENGSLMLGDQSKLEELNENSSYPQTQVHLSTLGKPNPKMVEQKMTAANASQRSAEEVQALDAAHEKIRGYSR